MEATPASVRRSFQETSRRCRVTRRESPAAAVSVREVSSRQSSASRGSCPSRAEMAMPTAAISFRLMAVRDSGKETAESPLPESRGRQSRFRLLRLLKWDR